MGSGLVYGIWPVGALTASLRLFSNAPGEPSVQACDTEEDLASDWTVPGNPLRRLDFPEEASVPGLNLSSFEDLYRSHGARMKSVAYNILGNATDAEDAVQEAFLRMYRNMGSFKGDAKLSTWMFRILINASHDIGRQRRRRRNETELGPEEQLPAPTAPAGGDASLRITLEKAVAALRPRHRDVFILYEVEGFLHREIAEILDMAEGTSKALLFEAKRELRSALGEARRPV
jgi:RNA polymerase sigma-70 factor (ECF subfamily)